jgi:hypothetical protein
VRALVTVAGVALVVILSQFFVLANPAYDTSTLLVGVLIPLVLGCGAFALNKDRVLLFAFVAFFWSLVDDAPVYFDSVYTWPEVTRFHPAIPHLLLEVLLHVVTAAFLVLALRESSKGRKLTTLRLFAVGTVAVAVFVLSYAQNIPLGPVQAFVEDNWYLLDIVEHLLALVLFGLAVVIIHGAKSNRQELSNPEIG